MLLTMQSGILFPISWLFGKIMDFIYNILAGDSGIASVGLCIIIFTIIVKIILIPLNVNMQKSTKLNSFIQPEISKIQKKYKNKTDQESMMKQNQEINAVYKKYGTSMTSGCLPSLIQFPIILGLYDVVRNVPAYVSSVKAFYTPIADKLINSVDNYQDILTSFVNDNNISLATNAVKNFGTGTESNVIIDVIDKFSSSQWQEFIKVMSDHTDVINAINSSLPSINASNEFFFGINIADAPGFKISIAFLIPIASTLLQFISMKLSMNQSKKNQNSENQMANTMMKTMMFMPIFSFFMCVILPCGLGIYWTISSLVSLIIQIGVNYYYDHIADMDLLLEKQMIKAEKKNAKKGNKKSFMERAMEASGMSNSSEDAPISKQISNKNLKSYDTRSVQGIDNSGKKYKSGSMASKANIMLNYDDVKGREK